MRKIILLIFVTVNLYSQELIIGEERVEPGIVFIFEGAVKDEVYPMSVNLLENQTNVHIEARVNWDTKKIPEGTPGGGFIPYLKISSIVTNQSTGLKTFVDLLPHINLIDNFHYARNISLPGKKNDMYSVEFFVNAPSKYDLFFHRDWKQMFGNSLIEDIKFKYSDINFLEIANASRN